MFLAGAPYVEGITGIDQRSDQWVSFNAQRVDRAGWTYETPLRGLERGDRFAWFDAHAGGAAPSALVEGGAAPPVGDPA